jgi:hypothetical protein
MTVLQETIYTTEVVPDAPTNRRPIDHGVVKLKPKRPPEVSVPKYSDNPTPQRYVEALNYFFKTHKYVRQPTKVFKKDSENMGWVNARDYDAWFASLPSTQWFDRPQLNKPASAQDTQDIQVRLSKRDESRLERPQDPLVADGRPGGKKGARSRRLFPPPKYVDMGKLSAELEKIAAAKNNPSVVPVVDHTWDKIPNHKGNGFEAIPAVTVSVQRGQKPRISSNGDRCRVRHAELLDSVTGTAAFTVARRLELNPGLATFSPWLSSIARNWERYKFRKLVFHYFTKTVYTSPGSVMIVPDFDALELAPKSEQIAFAYEFAKESVPYKDFAVALSPAHMHPQGVPKLCRQGAVPDTGATLDYDAGNCFIITVDGTSTLWGKVWIEYDVEFTSSQVSPFGSASGGFQSNTGSSATTAANFGTLTSNVGPELLVTASGNILTSLIEGSVLVCLQTTAATSAVQTGVPTADAGSATVGLLSGGTATTVLNQTTWWNCHVGSTLTFNNTLTGAATTILIVHNVQRLS